VDLVVEAERQALQLAEVVEPEAIGDLLAHQLGLVAGEARQQALEARHRDDDGAGDPESLDGVLLDEVLLGGAEVARVRLSGQVVDVLHLVDRGAE